MLKVVFALGVAVAFVGVFATPTGAVTCHVGQYRSNDACLPCAPGSFSTIRNAASCTTHKTCLKGQFVKKEPTPSSNRLCAFCASEGKFSNIVNAPSCTAYTICAAGVKQTKRPTPTSDRVCDGATTSTTNITAVVALFDPSGASKVSGIVTFLQFSNESFSRFTGTLTNLTDGLHGFHIHESGDLSGGCASARAHYNPFRKVHGGPADSNRHVGDLGNIQASGGVASFSGIDQQVQLHGDTSVIGRAVVVHALPDDLGRGGFSDSYTTGHAGARIACGVIGLKFTP